MAHHDWRNFAVGVIALAAVAGRLHALELHSPDIGEGRMLGAAQVYKGFGCDGGNRSPALSWSDVPAGTQSFAVTAYDPDAPTGSGWWHWIVYDIPASARGLAGGVGTSNMSDSIGKQARSDFGSNSFGGACPPPGDKPHRYVFTVYALKAPLLGVPADASAALIGFTLHAQALAKASITARHGR